MTSSDPSAPIDTSVPHTARRYDYRLVVTHATDDLMTPAIVQALADGGHVGDADTTLRSKARVAGFLDGLEMVEPGLQIVSDWRPEPGADRPPADHVSVYGGVARKGNRRPGSTPSAAIRSKGPLVTAGGVRR